MEKINKCGTCGEEIKGLAVMCPTLDETKRIRCEDCAMKDFDSKDMWKCNKIMVPEDACYVAFFNERTWKSTYQEDKYVTPRGEQVILDFNDKHELIGIELLGDKKRCQQFTHLLKSVKDGKR